MSDILQHKGGSDSPHYFIAIPSYGDVSPAFAFSLATTLAELVKNNINYSLEFYTGNCHVDDSRNRLVRDFLESPANELVFIDADLKFDPINFLKLIKHDVDIVAGVYPLKQENEAYPVHYLPGELKIENDLLEVMGAPTGFMKIKRNVLEELAKDSPKFPAKTDMPGQMMIPIIFERIFENNARMGGDIAFCHKWRKKGGRVYVDPTMIFCHYGTTKYTGSYLMYLKRDSKLGFSKEIQSIRDGKETNEDILQLSLGWGNDYYAATPEYLISSIYLARNVDGNVIECGSGLSSICMAAASKHTVYSLEHDPVWATVTRQNAEKLGIDNLKVIYAPLKDYGEYEWYDFPEDLPYDFKLLACDGPPRKTKGRRNGVVEIKDRMAKNCLVIFDDFEETVFGNIVQKLEIDGQKVDSGRPFMIGAVR